MENPTNITGEQNLDAEGRTIQFNMGKTIFLNFYVPNGSDLGPRLKYKLDFCKSIIKYTKSLLEKNYSVIIGADMNIAHTEIDLYSPKTNQKSSGFLPACRKIFTELLEVGFVDSFRYFNKGGGFYTWWSFRDPKRKLNQGWRYDYFLVSDNLITKIKRTAILKEVFGSDHCPILLEIEI
ncbi:hypothetical protein COU94_01825 [Candidatus Shapirobacteria bacterium CG10_big_fil_rev_8_21_14_0_10_38_8]|nr:MAG: hypothetical protein COU94_01825 [Candidatus Shapirobacteria bacterium CG10_big_fil_rev_8_21_14_0_10_38_8]